LTVTQETLTPHSRRMSHVSITVPLKECDSPPDLAVLSVPLLLIHHLCAVHASAFPLRPVIRFRQVAQFAPFRIEFLPFHLLPHSCYLSLALLVERLQPRWNCPFSLRGTTRGTFCGVVVRAAWTFPSCTRPRSDFLAKNFPSSANALRAYIEFVFSLLDLPFLSASISPFRVPGRAHANAFSFYAHPHPHGLQPPWATSRFFIFLPLSFPSNTYARSRGLDGTPFSPLYYI